MITPLEPDILEGEVRWALESITMNKASGGQGWRPRAPGCDGIGVAVRSYPMSEVRGSGREELPHVQGAAAVWVQEGQEEPLHIQDTPREEIPLVQGKEQWLRFAGAA